MLVIRNAQMDAMAAARAAVFEQELFEHCRMHRPEFLAMYGEQGTKAAIHAAIQHAEEYGIRSTGGISAFVKLMFVFGDDFDRDPEQPWASILQTHDLSTEAEKLDALTRAARLELAAGDQEM